MPLYKILLGFFASVDLSFIFLPEDPGDHAELRAPIYQNEASFPHTLSLNVLKGIAWLDCKKFRRFMKLRV